MFKPGDRVRLDEVYMRNTGQIAGPDTLSVWTIVKCNCDLCNQDFVAVNEYSEFWEMQRHICRSNLRRVGKARSKARKKNETRKK